MAHRTLLRSALVATLAAVAPLPAQEPEAANDWFERGVQAIDTGELARAAHLFRCVLIRQPGHPDARHNLALSTAELGVDPSEDLSAGGLRGAIEDLDPALCLALIAGLQSIGLVGWILTKRRRVLWLVPTALGLALAGLRAHYQWDAAPAWATVLAPRTPLKANEGGPQDVILTLRAGEAVRVEWWKGGWVLARHGDDRGWVARTAIDAIR